MSGFVITKLDFNNELFQKTLRKLDPKVQREAKVTISQLTLLDVSKAPQKLHLHTLKGKLVASAIDKSKKCAVYTFHLTADDKFKASFTFENGTAYFRVCGEHDWVDDNP